MYTVIETPCFPCKFTISKDGKTPLDNGDFSLWFHTREKANTKCVEMNRRAMNLAVRHNFIPDNLHFAVN